jgi:hypothetical protein
MLLTPAIIALLIASLVSMLMLGWSSFFGWQVLRGWDISSGSERQLVLERRTYLVSTLLAFVFAIQALSLLLFVFNAEQMSSLFVGAMCAVGTLNVNPYGMPALLLKVLVFFLAAVWLVINQLDIRGYDYPLTRHKYRLLLVITPFVALEAFLQLQYFLGLDADVITSCCGSLFGGERETLATELAGLPPRSAIWGFYTVMGFTIASALWYRCRQSGGYLLAGMSALGFAVAIVAIISFLSLYIYEHPHHHCPFCVLQGEYHFQGYLLYIPLFTATALGLGVGVIQPFHQIPSLRETAPLMARRLGMGTLLLFLFFTLWTTLAVWNSNLKLIDT